MHSLESRRWVRMVKLHSLGLQRLGGSDGMGLWGKQVQDVRSGLRILGFVSLHV